ncbi:MAG: c-type cytochrome [Sphingomonas sp.]
MGDGGVDPRTWQFHRGNIPNTGVILDPRPVTDPRNNTSALLAWDPVRQKAAWKVATPGAWSGGIAATAGGLVFQGDSRGGFNAFDDATGKKLWSFATGVPVLAPPISYQVKGRQYVTVIAGAGTGSSINGAGMPAIDYRTQPRRLLTFALGGKATLPVTPPFVLKAPEDPDFKRADAAMGRGAYGFAMHCMMCHGVNAEASGAAPDLRGSNVPVSAEAFDQVVRQGALVPAGMPRFGELSDEELADIRQYLRTRAADLRDAKR